MPRRRSRPGAEGRAEGHGTRPLTAVATKWITTYVRNNEQGKLKRYVAKLTEKGFDPEAIQATITSSSRAR